MTLKSFYAAGALAVLTACTPAIPDSGAGVPDRGRGVGFDNSVTAIRDREAALARSAQPAQAAPVNVAGAAGPTSQPAPVQTQTAQPAPVDPSEAAREAQAAAQARASNSGVAPVVASPSNAAPTIVSNPGISSEQDFGSVSSQRSIEGDAARIAANRQQYQVVAPTDLPTRAGGGQPNIVAYALQNKHPRGTQVWRRSGISSSSKHQRNCAAFASDDEAQIEFLATGGPQRDRKALDPDGDGYACGWDPAPFQNAAG